jgi:hypothetical protein
MTMKHRLCRAISLLKGKETAAISSWGFALTTVFCSQAFASATDSFEVSGTLVAEPLNFHKSEYRFKVWVDGCLWKFRGEPLGKSPVEYYEDAFDGTCVYYYQKLALAPGAAGVNTSLGVIETSNIPSESSSLAPPLWMAFCSSCYFKAAVTNWLPQIFDSGFETRYSGNRLRFDRVLHANSPHLPLGVDLFSDGHAYSRNANGQIQVDPFPEPFSMGFRSATYRAGVFTNANGSWIPMDFTLEVFLPALAEGKSSNDVTRLLVWTGKVDSIRTGLPTEADEFVPETDGKTLTEDRRFPVIGQSGTRVSYLNTNPGAWPPLSNKRVAGVYKALVENATAPVPSTGKVPQSGSRAFAIALVMLTVVPLLVLIFGRFRRVP